MNELLLDDFLNEHQNIVLGCDCLMGTASFLEGSKKNQLDFFDWQFLNIMKAFEIWFCVM